MNQIELNRAVALATGESVSIIRQMGFGIADPATVSYDPEPLRRPRTVNWDRLASRRPAYLPQRARLHRNSA